MNDTFYPLNDTLFKEAADGARKKAGFLSERVKPHFKEFVYQLAILFVLLIFFSFELDETKKQSLATLFEPSKLAFFANYVFAAIVINYVFLPAFYYNRKMVAFTISLLAIVTTVILIDELLLEQIFFPDTRGTHFPGLLFTLVETLPIIIIMVAFKLAWDTRRKQGELDRLEALMSESELQFLKSQMNPHFLFNNLNNLYAHAIEASPKTPSIILELSAVLRYMLYGCKTNLVSLDQEIQHLKNYVALNRLQIEDRAQIKFTETIQCMDYTIRPLVLIVFVENAFKHSSGSMSQGIVVDIHIEVSENGTLNFLCHNTYSPKYLPQGSDSGIGLANVQKRLALQYPDQHRLDIRDKGNSFSVNLMMKLHKAGER